MIIIDNKEEYPKLIIDAVSLIDTYDIFEEELIRLSSNYKLILLSRTISELAHLMQDRNISLAYKAERISSIINNHYDIISYDNVDSNPNTKIDYLHYLLDMSITNKTSILTNNNCLEILAKYNQIEVIHINAQGLRDINHRIIHPSDDELNELYTNPTHNIYNCFNNEYILLSDGSKIIDIKKWNGTKYIGIKSEELITEHMGTIRPLNIEQKLAFDMLQDNKSTIKVLLGDYGTGKDFLMLSHALKMQHDKKIEKIIWCRNNIELKDSKPIGALPDGVTDKLLPFAMTIADHVGGQTVLREMIAKNQIEIQHLGFMRGRDIKNSIVICTEAENMTKQQIQLLIGRISTNSMLWINGDYHQVDDKAFEYNNGLMSVIHALKGQRLFSFVKLNKVERSNTAELAHLLD